MKFKHPCRADANNVAVGGIVIGADGGAFGLVEEDAIADVERRGVVHGNGSWVYESRYGSITADDAA